MAGTSVFTLNKVAQFASMNNNNSAAGAAALSKQPQLQNSTVHINRNLSMEDSIGLSDGGTSQENSPASDDAIVSDDDDESDEPRAHFPPIPVRYHIP